MTRLKSALAVAGGLLILAAAQASAQNAVRIGTSSVGSTFYTLGVGAGEVVSKKTGINTTVQSVGGSAATVRGLGSERIEFGLANAFAAVTAYQGTYSFKKSGKIDIRLAMQGGANHRGLVARKGTGIKSIKDLEGKTVIGKRRPLPELELIINALFKVYGVDPGKVKVVSTTNTGQALKSLTVGSVDAAVVPYGPRSANIQKPFSDGVFDFLVVPREKRDAALKLLPPLIFGVTQTKDWYDGSNVEANVFAMNTLFVTRPGVSNETVYKVVKAIIENNDMFMTYHPEARDWTLKNTLTNVQLPFHPGSIAYFKEIGAWTPELVARQKELMGQ